MEPLLYDLPVEYRIESADGIGSRALVVFGTTRPLDGGRVAGELRYQLLDGTDLVGPQRALTASPADPYIHVRVVSLASSYLVVWLDRRADAPGLYLRRFSSGGELIGNAVRIGGGIAAHQTYGRSVIVAGTPGGGRMLLWHEIVDGRTRLTGLRVNPGGSLELPATEVGHILLQDLRFSALAGLTILRMDSSTVMIDRTGSIDVRPINEELLQGPYHLDADTSLLVVRGKMLEKYASPFAAEPEWSVPVPALDSAADNTVMVGRDSVGSPFVLFMTLESTGDRSSMGFFVISTWKMTYSVKGQPTFVSPEPYHLHKSINGAYNFPSGRLCEVQAIHSFQGCDNSMLVRMDGISRIIFHGEAGQWDDVRWDYSLDGTGMFRDNAQGYAFLCSNAATFMLRRSNGSCFAIVAANGDTISWTSPAAAHRNVVDQTGPRIVYRDGAFLCAWLDRSNGAILSTFSPSFAQESVSLDTLKHVFPGVKLGGSPGYLLKAESSTQQVENIDAFGSILVDVSNYSKLFETQSVHPLDPYTYYASATAFRLYESVDEHWSPLYIRAPDADPGAAGYATLRSDGSILGHNPVMRWLIVGLHEGERHYAAAVFPDSLYLISIEGKTIRTFRNPGIRESAYWLPVDTSNVLVIGRNRATMLEDNNVLYDFPLPLEAGNASVTPLSGSTFLRAYRVDSGSNILILETYGIDGVLLAEGRLNASTGRVFISETSYLQRPTDSAIAILRGTEDDGVHVTLLDKHLQVIVPDTVVSATRGKAINPSGVFVGDTLHVVWEDYRNGEADIYGNSVVTSPGPTSVAITLDAECVLQAEAMPNPAGGYFRLRFNRPVAPGTELELCDMLGVPVWHGEMAAGTSTAHVPLHGQRSGTYRLRWRSQGRSGSVQVIVMR